MSKYKLSSMDIGDVKVFPVTLWDKIRLAAHFTGKRWGRKYRTEKTKKTIRVYRDS